MASLRLLDHLISSFFFLLFFLHPFFYFRNADFYFCFFFFASAEELGGPGNSWLFPGARFFCTRYIYSETMFHGEKLSLPMGAAASIARVVRFYHRERRRRRRKVAKLFFSFSFVVVVVATTVAQKSRGCSSFLKATLRDLTWWHWEKKKINRAPSRTINTYVAASVHASSDFYLFLRLFYALIKYSTSPTLVGGPMNKRWTRRRWFVPFDFFLQKAGRWISSRTRAG